VVQEGVLSFLLPGPGDGLIHLPVEGDGPAQIRRLLLRCRGAGVLVDQAQPHLAHAHDVVGPGALQFGRPAWVAAAFHQPFPLRREAFALDPVQQTGLGHFYHQRVRAQRAA